MNYNVMQRIWPHKTGQLCPTPESIPDDPNKAQLGCFRMSKKGKKNLSGGMAGLSLEDGGSDGSDEELEQVEVRSSQQLLVQKEVSIL